jgi:hypothetical protein
MDVKEPLEFPFEGPFSFENILLFPISSGSFCLEGLSNIRIQTEEGKMMDKKRRLWINLGIMLVIIDLVAIQTEANGNSWNWKFFFSDAECDFYYDPDTVFRSAEDIVRVWWKEVFHTKEVLRSRGFTGSEYEKAVYQINVSEINCKKKASCRKFLMICSEEGTTILCNLHKRQLEEWVPVWQVLPTGVLYRELCR